eukprot:scaffold98426_cov70-Attheya_sp.AAC.3
MGVTPAPDIAQEIMDELFHLIEECDEYINEVGVFSDDYDEHLKLLDKILMILQEHGFTINPDKCEWAIQETDWLGYWLIPTETNPFVCQKHQFLPTHVAKTSSCPCAVVISTRKKEIQWTDFHTKAFNAMKALMVKDCLLLYPDPNIPYDIETDATSDYQMGSVIKQNGWPVAYFSRKLRDMQFKPIMLQYN